MKHNNPCGYAIADLKRLQKNLDDSICPNSIAINDMLIKMLEQSKKYLLTDIEYATTINDEPSYQISDNDKIAIELTFGTDVGNFHIICLAFDAAYAKLGGISLTDTETGEALNGIIVWPIIYESEYETWFPALQGSFVPVPVIDETGITSFLIPHSETYSCALEDGYDDVEYDTTLAKNAVLTALAVHEILINTKGFLISKIDVEPRKATSKKKPIGIFDYYSICPDYAQKQSITLH